MDPMFIRSSPWAEPNYDEEPKKRSARRPRDRGVLLFYCSDLTQIQLGSDRRQDNLGDQVIDFSAQPGNLLDQR